MGDEVTLNLPMRPRWTAPDPRIDAVRGCAAVERGPLVMCVESVDLPDRRHVDVLEVDPSVSPREVDGRVVVAGRLVESSHHAWPHGEAAGFAADRSEMIAVPLIPYHAWANRGPSTMRVWIPHTT